MMKLFQLKNSVNLVFCVIAVTLVGNLFLDYRRTQILSNTVNECVPAAIEKLAEE